MASYSLSGVINISGSPKTLKDVIYSFSKAEFFTVFVCECFQLSG